MTALQNRDKDEYIIRLGAFNQLCGEKKIKSATQILMFKLLDEFFRIGWREWLEMGNKPLLAAVGCRSQATLCSARAELMALGLIEYARGWRGSPGRYRLRRG